jgi:hypothetical protein
MLSTPISVDLAKLETHMHTNIHVFNDVHSFGNTSI